MAYISINEYIFRFFIGQVEFTYSTYFTLWNLRRPLVTTFHIINRSIAIDRTLQKRIAITYAEAAYETGYVQQAIGYSQLFAQQFVL